jgi:hypothetical protein
MYVEPWIFWLILAPIAAVSAIYVGYLILLLAGLLSLTIGMALSRACESMSAVVNGLASWYARGLSFLVSPFKHHGPWLDYAVMAILLIALSLGSVLWLAA